mgnify:CR=1 FL=1
MRAVRLGLRLGLFQLSLGIIPGWCKNHELWCLHSPAECNLRRTGEGKGKSKMSNKKERAKMRMKVYQTLMESSEEEAAETEGSNHGEESESGAESSE